MIVPVSSTRARKLGVARRDDARARAADLVLDVLPRGHVEAAQEVAALAVLAGHLGRGPVHDEVLALHRDVVVLDHPGRVALQHALEVDAGAGSVLLCEEDLPERQPEP